MKKLIMIKYGELTTKKANRKFFIETLTRNIERVLTGYNVKITKDRVRMYIEFNESDLNNTSIVLKLIYGNTTYLDEWSKSYRWTSSPFKRGRTSERSILISFLR